MCVDLGLSRMFEKTESFYCLNSWFGCWIFLFYGRVSLHSSAWLGTHYVVQAGLKLKAILLLQLPECWDYGVSYHPDLFICRALLWVLNTVWQLHSLSKAVWLLGCTVISQSLWLMDVVFREGADLELADAVTVWTYGDQSQLPSLTCVGLEPGLVRSLERVQGCVWMLLQG